MWINRAGSNYTPSQICDFLRLHTGAEFTEQELISAYRVGSILRNGDIWFQRLA
jgi:hypothetical protein